MTTSEIKTLREIKTRLTELAERLDGQSIGVKPVIKAQASVVCYGIRSDIQRLLGDEFSF